MKKYGLAVVMVSFVAMAVFAGQKGAKELDSKNIPEAVIKAFKSAYPNATVKETEKEKKHGKELYEIKSMEGTVKREVAYNADGSVYKLAESMDAKNLPDAVKNSISSAYPKGKITCATKIVKDNATKYKIRVRFTLTWKNIMVDETGQVLKREKKKK